MAESFPRPAQLVSATTIELERAGLDPAEAGRLAAAFELTRAAHRIDAPEQVLSVESAVMAMMPHLLDSISERVVALGLDRRSAVIAPILIAEGGIDRAQIDPRVLFGKLIRIGASSVILGHSHPSGDPTPSRADVRTTVRLIDAGALLDIEVLDHLVIAGDRWCSMRSEGLI
ncbi:MAG: hypothetical protein DCC49_11035 [Acidobacteria bacterium]|nr:MAG: hypothetical protein DCC49_11035 [Acidobacteriota bacterium]